MKFKGTKSYIATDDLSLSVNAAIALERPLLIPTVHHRHPTLENSSTSEHNYQILTRNIHPNIQINRNPI